MKKLLNQILAVFVLFCLLPFAAQAQIPDFCAATGDTTNTNYTCSSKGTGALNFQTIGAGAINFYTSATNRLTIGATGGLTSSAGITATTGNITATTGNIVIGTTDKGVVSASDATTVKICGGSDDATANGAFMLLDGDDVGGADSGTGVTLNVGNNTAAAFNVVHTATPKLTVNSGGPIFPAGLLREVRTVTDEDGQNATITAAEMGTGIIMHTSNTGGGTITTDTAANIIAGSGNLPPLTVDGQCVTTYFVNDGNQTDTFSAGANVTISDTGNTVVADSAATLLWCRTGAAAVSLHILQ